MGQAPAWRRRGARLALGSAIALVGVVAALIVSAGGGNTSKAFAVETQPGGGVTIKIYSLGELEGVELALAEAGIASQVTYLEAGMTCCEPHYHPSMAMLRTLQRGQPHFQPWAGFNYESSNGSLTIAIGDFQQRQEMDEEIRKAARQGDSSGADWPSFVIDPPGSGRPDSDHVERARTSWLPATGSLEQAGSQRNQKQSGAGVDRHRGAGASRRKQGRPL